MTATTFTILDDGTPARVPATVDGERVRLAPTAVETALGWKLTAEGLCRASICVPVRDRAVLESAAGLDLAALAAALGRPLAVDGAERAAYLGASAEDRGRPLAALEAPDFALPDLAGRIHRLSAHRGKKVLLVAYASW